MAGECPGEGVVRAVPPLTGDAAHRAAGEPQRHRRPGQAPAADIGHHRHSRECGKFTLDMPQGITGAPGQLRTARYRPQVLLNPVNGFCNKTGVV